MERVPALQTLCLTKVAARMWHEIDVKNLRLFSFYAKDRREFVEKRKILANKLARKKVNRLGLPEVVGEKLRDVFRAMGLKIYAWCGKPCLILRILEPRFPAEFAWTLGGRVDEKKTVEMLTEDESLEPEKRFQLACLYQRKERIYALWKKEPRVEKVLDFSDGGKIGQLKHQRVISTWTRILALEENSAESEETKNAREKLTRWKNTLRKLYDMRCFNQLLTNIETFDENNYEIC